MHLWNKFRKAAFTLAEVLVALAIVGVVAAMVLPILINKSQEMEFHSALRKTFSDFSQATKQLVQDNGGSLSNVCKDTYAHKCVRDWYAKYLSVQKQCRLGSTEGCWHTSVTLFNKNAASTWWTDDYYGLILTNGMLVRFIGYASDCISYTGPGHSICAYIMVDVNGFKKPNVIGEDIYIFELTKDNLLPVGNIYDSWQLRTCGPNDSGDGCTAYYLYNN